MPGPSTLEQLADWPRRHIELLPPEATEVLKKVWRRGVHLGTHYSGVGMSEAFSSYLDSAVEAFIKEGEGGESDGDGFGIHKVYGHEWNADSRNMLLLSEFAPTHVFGDICQRWGGEVAKACQD